MASGDGSTAVVLVLDGEVEVTIGRLDGLVPPDLSVVDALARLQLAARRRGWSIRLRNPSEELCRLLGLVGLRGVVGDVVADVPCLPGEAGREAEGGEHLGVQEVMEGRDPPP